MLPSGHRYSYEKGVLHRDISVGNILITGKSEHGRRGALIDYDNAILWKDHKVLADDPLSVRLFHSLSACFSSVLSGYSTIHVLRDAAEEIYFQRQ